MDWIVTGIIVLAVLALVAIFVMKARHQPGSVHGRFNFDGYKESELSQRGLIDRTKWR